MNFASIKESIKQNKVKSILAAMLVLLAVPVFALLTSYASVSATSTVQQAVTSPDDGQTKTMYWSGDNTQTTCFGGETCNTTISFVNHNREHAINVTLIGTVAVPTGETGAAIDAVNFAGNSCAYNSTSLGFSCTALSIPANTTLTNDLTIALNNAATSGQYNVTTSGNV